jgi:DNA adenine methylase
MPKGPAANAVKETGGADAPKPGKLSAFPWYGGKISHLAWLLPLLPDCGHYVEPFGGSGAVLINRRPSELETFNDLDGDVVNFFKTLRENREGLIGALKLSPNSRQEFSEAIGGMTGPLSDLERARRFFLRIKLSYMSQGAYNSPGNWRHCVNPALSPNRAATWASNVDGLRFVADRFMRVQIENRPASYVIEKYETPDTLFYVDPPYLWESRKHVKAYGHEMTGEDHAALAAALNACRCRVAISAYENPMTDELFPAPKWFKTKEKAKEHRMGGTRTEALYSNYDPFRQSRAPRLF